MRKILGWISFWPPLTLLTMMCAEIVLRYPCNHGAGFYLYLPLVCGLIVVSLVYGFGLKGAKTGLVLSLLCLALIVCSDWFNIYVDYDTWIGRGMPSWGQAVFVDAKVGAES